MDIFYSYFVVSIQLSGLPESRLQREGEKHQVRFPYERGPCV
jgi:hypothetical protein